MANIYDAFFILQFLICIIIILVKLYNIMSVGEFYDIKIIWLTFIGYFLAYAIGFVAFLANPEILIFLMLFKLETWFLLLVVCLFFGELLIHLSKTAKMPMKANFSKTEA